MDTGEVITGLNETWSFAGCTALEWGAGFMVFMLSSELVSHPGRAMPILLIAMVTTAFSMAGARKAFPDEEVGLRNFMMVWMGITPPGLPRPAIQQPFWSGAPARALSEKNHFDTLKLIQLFEKAEGEGEEEEDVDEMELLYGAAAQDEDNEEEIAEVLRKVAANE